MNSPPKVYLGDLCYLHDWDYTRPVPLNVGYIAAYLLKHHPDLPIEIFKDPRVLADRAERAPADILALSHYDWNSNLDLAVLRRAKRANPALVGVLGGPNFEADTPEWVHAFFERRPEVDFYITGEGEWSLMRLIELLDEYGGDPAAVPREALPSSIHGFDRERGEVVHNLLNPVDRLDLGTVPSPYLTGLMDPFLDEAHLAPIFETNRGCPYSCTFCCWGQATRSKVNQFPLETVFEEIRYAAERTVNPTGFMYIADGNFGIFERDLEIADVVQECTEKYGRPERIFIYFAKNTNDRIIQIAGKLNAVTSMSMSKQTLDDDVLANIKRSNIPVEQYDRLRTECEKRGIDSFCELIYGLPGESYEQYVDGVIKTLRSGQRVTMYPHVMIHGAESSSRQDREEYGIKTAFRVIPACVSTYEDLPCLEYEELVIETDALPHEDYHRLRLFQFLYFVLSREMFAEFHRGLRVVDLDIATVADAIATDEDNWPPLWARIVREQRWGVENEFIGAEEVKVEFTVDDLDPVKSDRGLPKLISSAAALEEFNGYLRDLLARRFGERIDDADMADLQLALDMSFDRIVCFEDPVAEKKLSYAYDLDAWITSESGRRLREFRSDQEFTYRLSANERLLQLVEESCEQLGDITDALYRVRQSMLFGRSGDSLYTYERVPVTDAAGAHLVAEEQRQQRETSEQHSQIATR